MTAPGKVCFFVIRSGVIGMLVIAAVAMVRAGDLQWPDGGLADYDVVWDSPSDGSTGSMPLGNGD
ncbi:MAG: hypothetical protein EA424_04740, partial [Planctomycetaceae bacterium]